MPELPEVETTLRGVSPHVKGQKVIAVCVRQPRLRWPVPDDLQMLQGEVIESLQRRAKYLLLNTKKGTVIIHLGMSGSLRICAQETEPGKHDHVDIVLDNSKLLRLCDPRRFGSVLWAQNVNKHPLLRNLGPEPLSEVFSANYLYEKSRNRKVNIKSFIMNAQVVVGVGNIYASESLYMAGINPKNLAGRISLKRYEKLVFSIKTVLSLAIEQGGTTLRDFVSADGQTGYFQLKLSVYGRTGEACPKCQTPIKQITQGQRSTYYCTVCQK